MLNLSFPSSPSDFLRVVGVYLRRVSFSSGWPFPFSPLIELVSVNTLIPFPFPPLSGELAGRCLSLFALPPPVVREAEAGVTLFLPLWGNHWRDDGPFPLVCLCKFVYADFCAFSSFFPLCNHEFSPAPPHRFSPSLLVYLLREVLSFFPFLSRKPANIFPPPHFRQSKSTLFVFPSLSAIWETRLPPPPPRLLASFPNSG